MIRRLVEKARAGESGGEILPHGPLVRLQRPCPPKRVRGLGPALEPGERVAVIGPGAPVVRTHRAKDLPTLRRRCVIAKRLRCLGPGVPQGKLGWTRAD